MKNKIKEAIETTLVIDNKQSIDRCVTKIIDIISNQPTVIQKQLCPKCNGQGVLSKPPFIPGDVHEWTSSETSYQCNLCNGKMVI